MGYNTTVIVMNDSLGDIKKDTDFGNKLAQAIAECFCYNKSVDVSALGYVNAATVIETHHADMTTFVAVGGNYGSVVETVSGYSHHKKEDQIKMLKELADNFGYNLVKKKHS